MAFMVSTQTQNKMSASDPVKWNITSAWFESGILMQSVTTVA